MDVRADDAEFARLLVEAQLSLIVNHVGNTIVSAGIPGTPKEISGSKRS
jgi:hypothetical protein